MLNTYLQKADENPLAIQAAVDEHLDYNAFAGLSSEYQELLAVLSTKKAKVKSDMNFLSWMYYKVHRQVLKKYEQYSTMQDIFTDGKYDCLTATSLYALLLTDLGYTSDIIETNYHIYLKITLDGNDILFESTDPINGFIANSVEIKNRIEEYSNEAKEGEYQFKTNIASNVSLSKLAGLHYYNAAVMAYNNKLLINTVDLLEKSVIFYHSSRTAEFGTVLANAIQQDLSISDKEKMDSYSRISQFLNATTTIASR